MTCTISAGATARYYTSEQARYYTSGQSAGDLDNTRHASVGKEPRGRIYDPSGVLAGFDAKHGAELADDDLFVQLMDGFLPDGTKVRRTAGKVGGTTSFDLTFSAPKPVSIAWAFALPERREAIEQAHRDAIYSAMRKVEERFANSRTGIGGKGPRARGSMIGFAFQHGETRPEYLNLDGTVAVDKLRAAIRTEPVTDPQLHTHLVLINAIRCDDGQWRTIADGLELMRWQKAIGAIYHSELARGLGDLGYTVIEPTHDDGIFGVQGISEDAQQQFSKRRQRLEALAAQNGKNLGDMSSAEARRIQMMTRRGKMPAAGDRFARWAEEGAPYGLTAEAIDGLVNTTPDHWRITDGNLHKDAEEYAYLQAQLAVETLVETEAYFADRELYEAVANAYIKAGGKLEHMESAILRLQEDGLVINLGFDQRENATAYSTKEMMDAEIELVDITRKGLGDCSHMLPREIVDKGIEQANATGRPLSDEQAAAVRHILCSPGQMSSVEGGAGTGKSYSLKVVSDIYKAAGFTCYGSALKWNTAQALREDTGVESYALTPLLHRIANGQIELDSKSVIIVDEAGQVDVRQLRDLARECRAAGARIVLTGDRKQILSVGAGPAFDLAIHAGVKPFRIETGRRMRDPEMQRAADLAADARGHDVIEALKQQGRLEVAFGDTAISRAVDKWEAYVSANPGKVAMVIARSNASVHALNMEMRDRLKKLGRLTGQEIMLSVAKPKTRRTMEIPVMVGDQLRFTRKSRELGVINGTVGVVKAISEGPLGQVVLDMDIEGRHVRVDTSVYCRADGKGTHLRHALATTAFSSQGATVDKAWAVLDGMGWTSNDFYVAISRARDGTDVIVDGEAYRRKIIGGAPINQRAEAARNIAEETIIDALGTTLSRSARKTSVLLRMRPDGDVEEACAKVEEVVEASKARARAKREAKAPRFITTPTQEELRREARTFAMETAEMAIGAAAVAEVDMDAPPPQAIIHAVEAMEAMIAPEFAPILAAYEKIGLLAMESEEHARVAMRKELAQITVQILQDPDLAAKAQYLGLQEHMRAMLSMGQDHDAGSPGNTGANPGSTDLPRPGLTIGSGIDL